MDLILWRHPDAAEGARDMERKLTAKGAKLFILGSQIRETPDGIIAACRQFIQILS